MTDRIVQKGFEYFYRGFYNQKNYQFYYSPTSLKIYNTFVIELDKRVNSNALGIQFLWKYCIFQFLYWHNLIISTPNNKIGFSHIFGKKAIERYFSRNKEYDWQLEDTCFQKKYKLIHSEFNNTLNTTATQPIKSFPNLIRARFLNTERGFEVCISQTTLFDKTDRSCIICKFSEECKELLKINYPNLYKKRYGR